MSRSKKSQAPAIAPLTLSAAALFAITAALPAFADQKADALLQQTKAAYNKVQTLSANYQTHAESNGETADSTAILQLKKPGLGWMKFSGPDKIMIAANGKTVYQTLPGNEYIKAPQSHGGLASFAARGLPISLFFGVQKTPIVDLSSNALRPTYIGLKTLGGVKCDVIQITGHANRNYTLRIFIRPDNKMISRTEITIESKGRRLFQSQDFLNYKLNAPIANGNFVVSLPKGATLYAPPQRSDADDGLIPVGKTAPAFSLPTPVGGNISLAEALRGKKAVLVNFWFYG